MIALQKIQPDISPPELNKKDSHTIFSNALTDEEQESLLFKIAEMLIGKDFKAVRKEKPQLAEIIKGFAIQKNILSDKKAKQKIKGYLEPEIEYNSEQTEEVEDERELEELKMELIINQHLYKLRSCLVNGIEERFYWMEPLTERALMQFQEQVLEMGHRQIYRDKLDPAYHEQDPVQTQYSTQRQTTIQRLDLAINEVSETENKSNGFFRNPNSLYFEKRETPTHPRLFEQQTTPFPNFPSPGIKNPNPLPQEDFSKEEFTSWCYLPQNQNGYLVRARSFMNQRMEPNESFEGPVFSLKPYLRNQEPQPGFGLVKKFTVTNRTDIHTINAFDNQIGNYVNVKIPGDSVYAQIDRHLGFTPDWKNYHFIDTETGEEQSGLYLEDVKEFKDSVREEMETVNEHNVRINGILVLINGEEPGKGTIPLQDYPVSEGDTIEVVYKTDRARYRAA